MHRRVRTIDKEMAPLFGEEIEEMLTSISRVITFRSPIIRWKEGKESDYSVTAIIDKDNGSNYIIIGSNMWNRLGKGGRRILLIQKCVHLAGLNHSGLYAFSDALPDFASIVLYRRIWGKDEHYQAIFEKAIELVNSIARK